MGLINRRQSTAEGIVKGLAHWQVAGLLAALCVAMGLFGEAGRETFMYNRMSVADGEYWRLLSAHFVHLGPTHLVLNLAGLVLVWLLVGRYFTTVQWLAVSSITIVATSAAFWFIDRSLLWYVGLSGVLHGLLMAGAMRGFRVLPSESAIILAIVAAKLAYEQIAGPMPGSESVSGGDVVVNAHLFGAIGGAIAAVALWRSAPEERSI
jgi:rhomboid family GlyGly-CTERM serine protease